MLMRSCCLEETNPPTVYVPVASADGGGYWDVDRAVARDDTLVRDSLFGHAVCSAFFQMHEVPGTEDARIALPGEYVYLSVPVDLMLRHAASLIMTSRYRIRAAPHVARWSCADCANRSAC